MKTLVSESFCDDMVVLCFACLGDMPDQQLGEFMNALLHLTTREVRRAVAEARERYLVASEN